jgi:Bifunctional DNA primase/polymerase, N-terminal
MSAEVLDFNNLTTALAYARWGWPVFPCCPSGPRRKTPMVTGGFHSATLDEARITYWWRRWPQALIGTPTGHLFVVLDIDPRNGGDRTMVELGFAELPVTPTVRTASGGSHLYFAPPEDEPLRNTQGSRGRGIGAGLDWRGVGGLVIVPSPGSGYEWVRRGLELAAIPEALRPAPETPQSVARAQGTGELDRDAEVALIRATSSILEAPAGEQETTLNGEAYGIGRLAAAGRVPRELALEVLLIAARAIPNHDPRRPWHPEQIEGKVRRAFAEGMANPRWPESSVERISRMVAKEAALDRRMAAWNV